MNRTFGLSTFCMLCFPLMLTTSCREPTKAGLPNSNPVQPETPVLHDPYFVETEGTVSPYGPTSITRNIIADRSGYIWLATWEGIIRYDGEFFNNLTNKENLKRFHAFAALEDRTGNIWITTIGAGVYRYDGKSFTNYTTKDGLANDRVTYVYEDRTGHIWFGTEGGASRYDPSTPVRPDGKMFTNFTTEQGLPNNDVNTMIEDRTGKFWFGTRGEACSYDGKTFTRFTNPEGAPFTNVRSIIEDSKGHIWLGGNDGLWRYDHQAFTNFSTDFTGYIYEDSKGNTWTSSETPTAARTWVLTRYDETGIATRILEREGMFFGIQEDRDGGIWLGTLNGVCRYDGKSFNFFREGQGQD